MICLIGGAPRVGKSIMAKKLALMTKAACVSTDEICETVMAKLIAEERHAKFPLPSFSGNPVKNKTTPQERVNLQVISARSLEPELDRIISDAIHSQKPLVIEGIHILPNHAEMLVQKYGSKKICAVFVESYDIHRIIDGIQKNTDPKNWLKGSNATVIRQVAEFIAAFTEYLQTEAKHHFCLYRERTDDFEADIKFVQGLRFQF